MMKRAFTLKPAMLAIVAALGLSYTPVLLAAGPDSLYISNAQSNVFLGSGLEYDVVEVTPEGSLSGLNGIRNMANISTLNNYGTITVGSAAVYNAGTIGTLNNYGTMTTSGGNLIGNTAGAKILALNNYGQMYGASYGTPVIVSYADGELGPITNTGTIFGDITTFGTQNLAIIGSSGAQMDVLTGVGTQMEKGRIDIAAGNLYFVSGNQLLNNDVKVLNGAVMNERANLFLTNTIFIDGQYG